MQNIGIDIEQVSRFKKGKIKPSFLKRIFTTKELDYCLKQANSAEHLAGRFAAKESVIKALALFSKKSLDYKNIEIINDKFGIPRISVKSKSHSKYQFLLSISHTKEVAVAVVILTSP